MPQISRLEKREWLLLILREKPLDILRLMKGLFLIWNRSGRQIDGFYKFVPYKYGPYSSELYTELKLAKRDQLVNNMRINFFEEFPGDETLSLAKLITFPSLI